MKRKFTALVLLIVFAFTLCVPAMALSPNALIQTSNFHELSIRSTVNDYFAQRKSFLAGAVATIPSAVEPMTADEAVHKEALTQAGYTFVESVIVINTVSYGETRAFATVTETMTVAGSGGTIQKTIVHDLTLFANSEGRPVVSSDGYSYDVFVSASYVPDEIQNFIDIVDPSATLCILNIANAQKGTTEDAKGSTVYNEWYAINYAEPGHEAYWRIADWCAIFVAWCANSADIPTTVIPHTASAPTMRNFYNNRAKFYNSSAYGGTYTPQAGDLFFANGTPESPGHVGLVTSVSNGCVHIVEGNNTGTTPPSVKVRTISLTSTELVGFGNPDYSGTGHSYSSGYSWNTKSHWRTCENCGGASSSELHTLTTDPVTGNSRCSVCPYGWAIAVERSIP